MNNLILRSLSGAVYVGFIVAAMLMGGWWFVALTILFAGYGVYEFNKMTNPQVNALTLTFDVIFADLIVAYGLYENKFLLYAIVVMIMARLVMQLYIKSEKNALNSIAYSLMAQLYVALPLFMLTMMYSWLPAEFLLAMFIMIWVNDSGAYIVGSLLGRKILPYKMFPRISPKKSWAGFFGGLLFVLIAAVVMFKMLSLPFSLPAMLGYGVVVVTFSTWGDLVESLIKRTIGVKDSGKFLPGHGGILDRIDSLLLVLPATWVYWAIILEM